MVPKKQAEGKRELPALGRAKELFDADQKGRKMALSAAFAVWQFRKKQRRIPDHCRAENVRITAVW